VATAEGWWDHHLARPLLGDLGPDQRERFPTALEARLRSLLADTDVVHTLSEGRPNRITELLDDAVYVMTERSSVPQPVPAWMVTVAWEQLTTTGRLTAKYLVANDGLNVKRSSFVCALLATLPDVTVVSRHPIELSYDGWGPRS
jgi:phage tail protein X